MLSRLSRKALKAALAFNDVEFPFSHDLELLIQLCEKSGIEMGPALNGVGDLTPFAGIERYGSEEELRTLLDRDQALRWAATAVEWARGQIEPRSSDTDPADSGADNPGEAGSS